MTMFATANRIFLLLVTLTLSAHGVHGFTRGAPQGTCQEMFPNHGADPQGGTAPFTITASKMTYSPGETLTVSLQSTDGTPFIGLLLQARSGNNIVGSFTPPANAAVQILDCGTGYAITHRPGLSTTSLTVTWTAPAQSSGPIRFRATFVRNKATFWVGVETADIVLTQSTGAANTNPANTVVTSAVTNNAVTNKAVGGVPSTPAMPGVNANAAGNGGNHGNRFISSITSLFFCMLLGFVLYNM